MKERNKNAPDLKWDADRKRERERDEKREQEKAKALIGKIYASWKAEFTKQSRTRREVIQWLYRLRDDILKEAKYLAENKLGDFSDFTYKIISEKISALMSMYVPGNVIKQHVPVQLVASGAVAVPKSAQFTDSKSLLTVDFVKWFTDQPGFTGLSWHKEEKPLAIEFYLMAHYATGDTWLVGTLWNDEALQDLPRYEDMAQVIPLDFVALRQTGSTAQAGESPSATPPTGASEADAASTGDASANPSTPGQS